MASSSSASFTPLFSSSSSSSLSSSKSTFLRTHNNSFISLSNFPSLPSLQSHPLSIQNTALNTAIQSSVNITKTVFSETSKPTILVSEKLGEAGLNLLSSYGNVECCYDLSKDNLCKKIATCDALIVRSGTKVSREVFEAGKGRLKVVGRAGVGIDNVDVEAATEYGCLVVNAPTANTIAAAEHGIALLAAMSRNVAQADASMKAGKWERNKYVGRSLVGKTLAVIGFGKVGSEVARRGKGLGMNVIAHDPYASIDRARAIGVDLVSFDQAISSADFISLHMPLTPSTLNLFNDDTFNKTKDGVCVINVARGGVIDEHALLRALETKKVAQAALDVFSEEPPSKDNKLLQHKNVIVTPHLGASTKEAQEGVAIEIAEAIIGALNGEVSSTALNAPMVTNEVLTELSPYVLLAEKIGKLAVQLVSGGKGIKAVKIVYKSGRNPDDLDTRLLRAMITKGIVEPISSSYINLVNADFVAKQKSLHIREEKMVIDASPEFPIHSIQVVISDVDSKFASATCEACGQINVEGRVKFGIPHLTKIGAFDVDVSLAGNLILCRQVDQPGMIGQVGNILGRHNVNVNFMSVGRTTRKKQGIMAIGVDEEPGADALREIGEVSAVEEVVFLKL